MKLDSVRLDVGWIRVFGKNKSDIAWTYPFYVQDTSEFSRAVTLDASGEGAGGVWVSGLQSIAPIVWRLEWPQEMRDRLVTFANPSGDITNSDLEMAAEVLGWLVLEAVVAV